MGDAPMMPDEPHVQPGPSDVRAMEALFHALWEVTVTEPVSDGPLLRMLIGERELAARDLRQAKASLPAEACYACGRPMKSDGAQCVTEDGQRQRVGHDCWYHIHRAGRLGWQPPRGGPRLYRPEDAP